MSRRESEEGEEERLACRQHEPPGWGWHIVDTRGALGLDSLV